MRDDATVRDEVVRRGHGHLLSFWGELNRDQRRQFLDDLRRIDFDTVDALVPTHVRSVPRVRMDSTPEPAVAFPARPDPGTQIRYAEAMSRGQQLLAEGKVAVVVVAGGQGSRLGFDRPKGEFPISPVRGKPLFQLFGEAIGATAKRYGRPVPWYVMTGPTTDAATRRFFAEHEHFGLPPDTVYPFCQGVMPALDFEGRILLDQKHRVALSPDGHGGCLRALASSGALADMRRRGVELLSYFQVDNPLVAPADPLVLGLHAATGAEMSAIAVAKADDLERVGHFARVDGRLCVIEYSDMPEELARARNADGSRHFDHGSIAVHGFSRTFLERVTGASGECALPWHRAEKRVPFVNLASGEREVPDGPNAIKLELFVFDALPLARTTMLLERDRAEWFSPVKNAAGVDSPDTARRDLSRRAARWLEACGVTIPRSPDGEPDGVFEISPTLALDAEQLRAALTDVPTIKPGEKVYLA